MLCAFAQDARQERATVPASKIHAEHRQGRDRLRDSHRHRSCWGTGYGYPSRTVSKRKATPIEAGGNADTNEETERNRESAAEAAEFAKQRGIRARSARIGRPGFAQIHPRQRKPGKAGHELESARIPRKGLAGSTLSQGASEAYARARIEQLIEPRRRTLARGLLGSA